MNAKRTAGAKQRGRLILYADRYCQDISKKHGTFYIWHTSDYEMEIEYKTIRRIINIRDKTCSCKRWQLIGLPCIQAVNFIGTIRNAKWDMFCADHFTVHRYLLERFSLKSVFFCQNDNLNLLHFLHAGTSSHMPSLLHHSHPRISALQWTRVIHWFPHVKRPRGRPRKKKNAVKGWGMTAQGAACLEEYTNARDAKDMGITRAYAITQLIHHLRKFFNPQRVMMLLLLQKLPKLLPGMLHMVYVQSSSSSPLQNNMHSNNPMHSTCSCSMYRCTAGAVSGATATSLLNHICC